MFSDFYPFVFCFYFNYWFHVNIFSILFMMVNFASLQKSWPSLTLDCFDLLRCFCACIYLIYNKMAILTFQLLLFSNVYIPVNIYIYFFAFTVWYVVKFQCLFRWEICDCVSSFVYRKGFCFITKFRIYWGFPMDYFIHGFLWITSFRVPLDCFIQGFLWITLLRGSNGLLYSGVPMDYIIEVFQWNTLFRGSYALLYWGFLIDYFIQGILWIIYWGFPMDYFIQGFLWITLFRGSSRLLYWGFPLDYFIVNCVVAADHFSKYI